MKGKGDGTLPGAGVTGQGARPGTSCIDDTASAPALGTQGQLPNPDPADKCSLFSTILMIFLMTRPAK